MQLKSQMVSIRGNQPVPQAPVTLPPTQSSRYPTNKRLTFKLILKFNLYFKFIAYSVLLFDKLGRFF